MPENVTKKDAICRHDAIQRNKGCEISTCIALYTVPLNYSNTTFISSLWIRPCHTDAKHCTVVYADCQIIADVCSCLCINNQLSEQGYGQSTFIQCRYYLATNSFSKSYVGSYSIFFNTFCVILSRHEVANKVNSDTCK